MASGLTTTTDPGDRDPSAGDTPDLLARLKAETAREHAAIEAVAGVMHADLCWPEYRRYLERFYGFYQRVEPSAWLGQAWQRLGLDSQARAKLPHLRRDLAQLGADLAQVELSPVFEPGGPAEAAGAVYVLEGSTLGGRVIARHVRACLGAEAPRAFVEGYGAATGERWRAAQQALRRTVATPAESARAVLGAQRTFRALTEWFGASAPTRATSARRPSGAAE